jgi:hypothetical protein
MSPIRVYKRSRPADAPKPLLDPEQRHADELSAVSAQLSAEADEEKKADS